MKAMIREEREAVSEFLVNQAREGERDAGGPREGGVARARCIR